MKIDYHLSHYRGATRALSNGVFPPKEMARIETIRDASLTAIALEFGVIQEIGSGKLSREPWLRTLQLIRDYEVSAA
jgi:hypothetical protein